MMAQRCPIDFGQTSNVITTTTTTTTITNITTNTTTNTVTTNITTTTRIIPHHHEHHINRNQPNIFGKTIPMMLKLKSLYTKVYSIYFFLTKTEFLKQRTAPNMRELMATITPFVRVCVCTLYTNLLEKRILCVTR